MKIALVLQSASGYGWKAGLGIRRFARTRPAWELRVWEPALESLRSLAAWRPDGVVGYLGAPPLARRLARWGVPVVNISQASARSPFPLVTVDNFALGRDAGRFLASLGRKGHAVVAARPSEYARLRMEGFLRALPAARRPKLDGAWLDALPKPAAVFACDDFAAERVARLCAEAGLLVPGDVAILGADNEPDGALSSVGIPAERIGMAAAGLLDRLLREGRAPRRPTLLPPLPVVERASTGCARGVPDIVTAALAYIDANAGRGIGVEDVVRHVPAGRRTLERLFRAHTGRPIYPHLRRARAAPLKALLAETDLTLEEIAEKRGFHSAQHLSEFFRALEGISPGAWRRRFK
ncbi:MAG TPA: substrate-binding domain-containing protein [Planctomycetota bacterium]